MSAIALVVIADIRSACIESGLCAFAASWFSCWTAPIFRFPKK
jgi:hypothetical protein